MTSFYTDDQEQFRKVVAQFVAKEVEPHQDSWLDQGLTGRQVWKAAGRQGVIGLSGPERFGGAGLLRDFRYRSIVIEELARVGSASLQSSFTVHDDILIPYVAHLGTEEQKQRWLPSMCSGETIAAIAMTEPGAGSDLKGLRTSAARVDGGWVVNGSKTFITSGLQAGLVVTAVRTDPQGGSRGFSLLVVEDGMPGFSRGAKLNKMGLRAQDTAELFFDEVFVPDDNLLGEEGRGFAQLMHHLPLERLGIAATALAAAAAAFRWTVAYVDERSAFGKPVADQQATRFVLADVATEIEVGTGYFQRVVERYNAGDFSAVDAAKAKLWMSELQGRVVDRCLQLHGGYGYMMEYPIARAYLDARVQRIYGGTNEIMREIIGRDIFGRR